MSPTLVRPPAKATKKKSGKRAGAKNAGLVKYLYVCLPATAHATAKKPPTLSHPRAHRGRRPADGEHHDRRRAAEAEQEGLAVPAGDDQAADALDEVAYRVDRGDKPEPVLLYKVSRQVDGRHEDRHEKERERALERPHGARPHRQHRAEATEAQGPEARERS